MAAKRRKHAGTSIADLRRLANLDPGNVVQIDEIVEELSQRGTQVADVLRLELEELRAGLAGPGSTGAADDEVGRTPCDLLRATFTIAGEKLARWGMTEAMPRDIMSSVAALWAERVGESEDGAGRSLGRLRQDMAEVGVSIGPVPRAEASSDAE